MAYSVDLYRREYGVGRGPRIPALTPKTGDKIVALQIGGRNFTLPTPVSAGQNLTRARTGLAPTRPIVTGTPATGIGVAAGLAAIPAIGGALAAGYGVAQAIGVQFPWETGAGEGFIAPWSRDIVKDEGERWVTRETRPDLFGDGDGGELVFPAESAALSVSGVAGPGVVKTWSANGWPFAMTSDGRIHTVTKSGIRKSWKPYKSVVLGKKMNQGMALRAVRKLQGIKKLADKIERLGGTRTIYRKK